MIVIDTSAWVEFLRGTDSPTCNAVDRLLSADTAICDPIVMEVLAGARDEVHLAQLRGLLSRSSMLATESSSYDNAALLCRTCRRSGATVRKMIDCLIAAVCIENDAHLLHNDADFDVLAAHTDLVIYPVGPNG